MRRTSSSTAPGPASRKNHNPLHDGSGDGGDFLGGSPTSSSSSLSSLGSSSDTTTIAVFEFDGTSSMPSSSSSTSSSAANGEGGGGGAGGGGSSTVLASVINLANTIVGSGMLALPAAFASCGYILGTIFLLLFAASSAFGLHLLSLCALRTGLPSSFRRVTAMALPGDRWSALIDATVAFKCFGVATSYLVVVGDTIPAVVRAAAGDEEEEGGVGEGGGGGLYESRQFWVLVGAALIAPLCFLPSLDKLKFTSALSLCFVAFLTTVVLVVAFVDGSVGGVDHGGGADNDNHESSSATAGSSGSGTATIDGVAVDDYEEPVAFSFDGNAMSHLTVFVFGFTCHQVRVVR